MARHTEVWLLARGGPDRPESVQPFLQRMFNDPLVVRLPLGWMQRIFAWLLSRLRTRALLPCYKQIGGASPQLDMVEQQAHLLNRALGRRYTCLPIFRYWGPSAEQAAAAIKPGAQIVLLSLYPHARPERSGTAIAHARRAIASRTDNIAVVASYPSDPGFVEAVSETLREAIVDLPANTPYEVIFVACGTGSSYHSQLRDTVEAVVKAANLARPHHLSFQPEVGSRRCPNPTTVDTLRDLGRRGVDGVIVVPLTFTSEHLETRVGLEAELAQAAEAAGLRVFRRAATVATRPTFIRCLSALVRHAEREADWVVPEDDIQRAAEKVWAAASSS